MHLTLFDFLKLKIHSSLDFCRLGKSLEANQDSISIVSSYVFSNFSAFLFFFNQSQISTVSQSTIATMFYFFLKGTIFSLFLHQELIFMEPQNFICPLSVAKTFFPLNFIWGIGKLVFSDEY